MAKVRGAARILVRRQPAPSPCKFGGRQSAAAGGDQQQHFSLNKAHSLCDPLAYGPIPPSLGLHPPLFPSCPMSTFTTSLGFFLATFAPPAGQMGSSIGKGRKINRENAHRKTGRESLLATKWIYSIGCPATVLHSCNRIFGPISAKEQLLEWNRQQQKFVRGIVHLHVPKQKAFLSTPQ